ncbi:MAG: putative manganese transporter [Candidatus Cryptobacteroides sp.]
MIFHILADVLRNAILITGLVVIMMMMIESLNIESRGKLFSGLKGSRMGQILLSALLGSIPGCMGGFATVSLYTHRMVSFGALVAMMIASSGDEAFVLLAMVPDKAVWIFLILFAVAVAAGLLVDFIAGKRAGKGKTSILSETADTVCADGYEVHEADGHDSNKGSKRHFGWKRIVMLAGVSIFIAALATGRLEHEHGEGTEGKEICMEHHHCQDGEACAEHHHDSGDEEEHIFRVNLLDEEWMNILFAALSIIVLVVLFAGSDHFVEEHLWNHIVRKHLISIFLWTFGVLLLIGIGLTYVDIGSWISGNTALMIILATAVGIIPESGPHLVFVTLYASGIVPLPVLLASCISQDGHASIPLLAESKSGFLKAKAVNCAVALLVGFASMLFV